MALIEFKDYPNTTTPLNAENLNNNFNELNKANTYSTQEQVIGTWLDKPLYRRVFELTTPSELDVSTPINIADNIKIKSFNGYFIYNEHAYNYEFPLNYNASNWYFSTVVEYSGTMAMLAMHTTNAAGINRTAYVTIEYTKTTD